MPIPPHRQGRVSVGVRNPAHSQKVAGSRDPMCFKGGARRQPARRDGREAAADSLPENSQKSIQHAHSTSDKSPDRVGSAHAYPVPALTPRESEVLEWIAEGKRDSEIATILAASVRTIHKHVQRILAKLS